MREYEARRAVSVPAEQAFAVAADLGRTPDWVPYVHAVTEPGPDRVTVTGPDDERDGLYRARPEQRRVEWGSERTGEYAGWLQVEGSGTDDDACEVVVHLSFLGDQPAVHGGRAQREVEADLRTALDRLADLCEGGSST